jgi:hypothetical protein
LTTDERAWYEQSSSRVARVIWPAQVSLLVVICSAPVHAEPGEQPAVRLRYTAPAECPDAANFSAQVRERTARGRFAEPSELARTFNVELSAEAQGFSGDIEFLDDGGAHVSRHVHGEQCAAVVSSLALITALALDATLRSEANEAHEATAPSQAFDTPTPAELVAPIPTPTPVNQRQSSPSGVERNRRAVRGARVGALVGYGTAISAARLGILGQLDFRSGWALRLTAHFARQEQAVDPGRSASLQRLGFETSLCPFRFGHGALNLMPCAALDFGSLRAAGVPSEQLTSVREETIWWGSVGAQLGLSWEPDAPLWVELRVAAEVPLRAGYRFRFENPDQTAYQVPSIAGWSAITAGVRF